MLLIASGEVDVSSRGTWSVHKITKNVEKDLDQIFRVDRSQAWNKMIKCSVSEWCKICN